MPGAGRTRVRPQSVFQKLLLKRTRVHGGIFKMDYRQAIDFIEGASGKGDKRGLYNMERLMERLGQSA